jgi:hypothetical protein
MGIHSCEVYPNRRLPGGHETYKKFFVFFPWEFLSTGAEQDSLAVTESQLRAGIWLKYRPLQLNSDTSNTAKTRGKKLHDFLF